MPKSQEPEDASPGEARTTTPVTSAKAVLRPVDRYVGRRHDGRRNGIGVWIGSAVLSAAAVLASYSFARPLFGSPQDARFTLTGYKIEDAADAVTVRWTVDHPAGQRTLCVVRSRGVLGQEIGRAEVPVPPEAGDRVQMSYRLLTVGRPNTGEVINCGLVDGAAAESH